MARGKVSNRPSFTGKRREPKRRVSTWAVPSQPRPSQLLVPPSPLERFPARPFSPPQPLAVSGFELLRAGPSLLVQPLAVSPWAVSLREEAPSQALDLPEGPTFIQAKKVRASSLSGSRRWAVRKHSFASSIRSSW